MKILLLDIAWLAGLLEGEGSFRLHGRTPAIALQMVDQDIVKRAADLFKRPCNGPYGPYGQSKLPTYQTLVTGRDAIGWMFTLYSFLGERRRQQIEKVVENWKTMQTVASERHPICHPDKQYFAKGFCNICYMKQYHALKKAA